MCLYSKGVLPREHEDARVSWCIHGERSQGTVFFLFFFWFETWRGEDRETVRKDSWCPQDAISAKLKMHIFLCCTGLNVSSYFSLYFSCLSIQVYRIVAVCFVILTGKEACEGPTQVLRSEGKLKLLAVFINFINFSTLLKIRNKERNLNSLQKVWKRSNRNKKLKKRYFAFYLL